MNHDVMCQECPREKVSFLMKMYSCVYENSWILFQKKNDWKSLNQNYYLIQKCQKTICSDVCPDASIKEPRELKQQALEKLERVSAIDMWKRGIPEQQQKP